MHGLHIFGGLCCSDIGHFMPACCWVRVYRVIFLCHEGKGLRLRACVLTSAASVLQTLTGEFVWDAGVLWSQVLYHHADVVDYQDRMLHIAWLRRQVDPHQSLLSTGC